MKLLLYCTKSKPYLNDYRLMEGCNQFVLMSKPCNNLNGKIVAECDYEVEKIIDKEITKNKYSFGTQTIQINELLKESCLTLYELCKYIGTKTNWDEGDYGYAIQIENLKIFNEPKELEDCIAVKEIKINSYLNKCSFYKLKKAPKNMCYCCCYGEEEEYILISIRPEYLCKILNGEKKIEVRKKVLKEML